MNGNCYLDDDGGSEVRAVEEAGPGCCRQSLHVRVGPVFYDSDVPGTEPGVWIEYQEEHEASLPAGPVLLTPAVWRELNAAVETRLKRKGYGRWRTRLPGVRRRR